MEFNYSEVFVKVEFKLFRNSIEPLFNSKVYVFINFCYFSIRVDFFVTCLTGFLFIY